MLDLNVLPAVIEARRCAFRCAILSLSLFPVFSTINRFIRNLRCLFALLHARRSVSRNNDASRSTFRGSRNGLAVVAARTLICNIFTLSSTDDSQIMRVRLGTLHQALRSLRSISGECARGCLGSRKLVEYTHIHTRACEKRRRHIFIQSNENDLSGWGNLIARKQWKLAQMQFYDA